MRDRPKIHAITTCSAAGWEQYGKRMALSWVKHWTVTLTVWSEGFTVDVPGVLDVKLGSVRWLQDFKAQHRALPKENYRMDAVRFAHKTAAVIEAALFEAALGTEHLIWVDADTVTHSRVPDPFVASLLPRGEEFISWLDRFNNYPECGFYVLNLAHPRMVERLETWRAWYTSGELFRLAEWHDSFVLQQLVERAGLATKSLSGPKARLTSHPFINGPLGAYMDHMKGPRKAAGKSNRRDLKVARPEPYWRSIR